MLVILLLSQCASAVICKGCRKHVGYTTRQEYLDHKYLGIRKGYQCQQSQRKKSVERSRSRSTSCTPKAHNIAKSRQSDSRSPPKAPRTLTVASSTSSRRSSRVRQRSNTFVKPVIKGLERNTQQKQYARRGCASAQY